MRLKRFVAACLAVAFGCAIVADLAHNLDAGWMPVHIVTSTVGMSCIFTVFLIVLWLAWEIDA